jgi:hypothetical protein
MKTANSNQIERAFRLGQPIDDAVKRAVQLAKQNQSPPSTKSKAALKSRTQQKNK